MFPILLLLSLLPVLEILASPVINLEHQRLNTRQTSLADCLIAQNVPTSLTTSAGWSTLIAPYNLRLAYAPAAVTIPNTPQQVADSVICAARAGVKVQAKSGGHSYASFSSGGKDGSLIIDLQSFNSISVDQSTGIATVGGGVRLGNLALGIYSQGQRALPHGTCPGVGVGGHFTHGGYGYDSRAWGLALDTIVALDAVLANGTILNTNSNNYPEIYFALRGAADSFGIVTSFYLQTLSAPETVINFSLSFSSLLNSVSAATAAFSSIQSFVLTSSLMTRNLTFGFYIDSASFSLSGWYMGNSLDYFTNTLLPALTAGFPPPSSSVIEALSWLDSLVNEGGTLAEPLTGYNAHDTFYAKSITTRESKPLTKAALSSFFNYVIIQGKSAPDPWFSIINLYGGLDSQINAVSVNTSAYSDRDSLWVFQNYGYTKNSLPPFDPDIVGFIEGINAAITNAQPDGNFGAYLNYVDPDLSAQQAANLYYEPTLYSKLSGLKTVLDPDFVFWNPQAIGNAASSATTTTLLTTSTMRICATSTTTTTVYPPTRPTLIASPDGRCGPDTGYTCLNSPVITTVGAQGCCSQYGWCGVTEAYCSAGCQQDFGHCVE